MSDSQWPRYVVFKQDDAEKAHAAVGTVHAPSAEMALLHARDVYGRRPSAVSMWVVLETAVFSMTAEQIAANPPIAAATGTPKQLFYLFNKQTQRRSMAFVKFVGEIVAETAVSALQQAIANGGCAKKEVSVWWVVPAAAISKSNPDDIASDFAPALDKTYRQQGSYGLTRPQQGDK